jgi:hypothetical protein
MIKYLCHFCLNALKFQEEHAGNTIFDLYICRDCRAPLYKTLYRQLYFKNKLELLVDYTRIDEFVITRYFKPNIPNGKYNYSIIFKEALGIIESSPNMEPMTLNKPVCEVNYIIELPAHDIPLLKHKLNIWATFS